MATATTPAFTVTLTATQVTLFSLDEAAFDRWCATKGDELQREVPRWTDPAAGNALSDLVHDARQAGVIHGAPNFELLVTGDDDPAVEVSGFYAVLKNVVGDQRLIGLTSGWTEVARVGADTAARQGAREHLDEVCAVANDVLRAIGVAESTTASAHRHFGYWINRALRTARCYECQYQFVGTEDTAQDWLPD